MIHLKDDKALKENVSLNVTRKIVQFVMKHGDYDADEVLVVEAHLNLKNIPDTGIACIQDLNPYVLIQVHLREWEKQNPNGQHACLLHEIGHLKTCGPKDEAECQAHLWAMEYAYENNMKELLPELIDLLTSWYYGKLEDEHDLPYRKAYDMFFADKELVDKYKLQKNKDDHD